MVLPSAWRQATRMLEVSGLQAGYRSVQILHDITMTIGPGEIKINTQASLRYGARC